MVLDSKSNEDPFMCGHIMRLITSPDSCIDRILLEKSKALEIFLPFLQSENTDVTWKRFCRILDRIILVSPFDILGKISNGKSFLQGLIYNLHRLPVFDFCMNLVPSRVYSIVLFCENGDLSGLLTRELDVVHHEEQVLRLLRSICDSHPPKEPLLDPIITQDMTAKFLNIATNVTSRRPGVAAFRLLISLVQHHHLGDLSLKFLCEQSTRICQFVLRTTVFDAGRTSAISLITAVIQKYEGRCPNKTAEPLDFRNKRHASITEDDFQQFPVIKRKQIDETEISEGRQSCNEITDYVPQSPLQLAPIEGNGLNTLDLPSLMDLAMRGRPSLEPIPKWPTDGVVQNILGKAQSRLLMESIEELSDEVDSDEVSDAEEEEGLPFSVDLSVLSDLAVFLIDRFFVHRENSFLHNAVVELLKALSKVSGVMEGIIRKSEIIDKVLWSRFVERSQACYWGQIHEFSKMLVECPEWVPVECKEKWDDYLTNVSEPMEQIIQANFGGDLAEIQKMFGQRSRTLRPDL
jgi:hypothetical protein